MKSHIVRYTLAILLLASMAPGQQLLDEAYAEKIKQYTTAPEFLTDLVDHLPASDTVPSPEETLGYIAGAENHLTYAKDVHRYMREIARTSERVRVSTMGHSEEGRESILVVISDEANLARLDHFKTITAKLADPRELSPEQAESLIGEGLPIYWVQGAIHSPETGAPEMLMELAYRLAVDESPFYESIRKNSIVMITPVVEVDGRERVVDLDRYAQANPGKAQPPLLYWGKYVVHDNNRDGMALSLALSRMAMKTFLEYHPQVFHDLHESIPFLYVSTGTGPYNAWLDPIVTNEWQKLSWNEVEGLTKRGVPGVWTHGFYNGWGGNYMMITAQGHNSIGRFYETFGNRTSKTMEREVPDRFSRKEWYRQSPPYKKVRWSLRNNVNLQQSGVLLSLDYVARNKEEFLKNFYLKSRRSVEKARKEGPVAWVIPGDDPRPLAAAGLVNLLRLQGVEVHRLDEAVEKPEEFPAGSYVVRMDQPYSRMADMMFDRQYYNPSDPSPYDDTGWSVGPLRHVKTVRLTGAAILDAPMTLLEADAEIAGSLTGPDNAAAYLVKHNTENALATLRYRLSDIRILAAEESFAIDSEEFAAGTFLIPAEGNPDNLRGQLESAAESLGVNVRALGSAPDVPTHEVAAPRIALVHTWTSTQSEGWVRMALDNLEIPYHYISDHVIRDTANLRERYDVILFGPTRGSAQDIVNGLNAPGDPIPWKASELTPNIGTSPDQTGDMRGGMGLQGLIHLKKFVESGGLFVTVQGNASIPISFGLIEGVSIRPAKNLKVQGAVVNAVVADKASPITYGYADQFAVYFSRSPLFQVSQTGGLARRAPEKPPERATGRGTKEDPDTPQGRPYVEPEEPPKVEPGEELPLDPYMKERYGAYLPPLEERPRVVLRFAKAKDLPISGLISGASELANRPAIVDVPLGEGHVVLFANNPVWRASTQGSYFLLFNAMLHYDNLGAGRSAE